MHGDHDHYEGEDHHHHEEEDCETKIKHDFVLKSQIKNRFIHRLSFRGIYDLYDQVEVTGTATQKVNE